MSAVSSGSYHSLGLKASRLSRRPDRALAQRGHGDRNVGGTDVLASGQGGQTLDRDADEPGDGLRLGVAQLVELPGDVAHRAVALTQLDGEGPVSDVAHRGRVAVKSQGVRQGSGPLRGVLARRLDDGGIAALEVTAPGRGEGIDRLVTGHLGQVVQGAVGQVGVALREGGAGLGRQDVVPGGATAATLTRLGRSVNLDLLSVLKCRDVPAHGGRRQAQDPGELRRRHRPLLSDEVENTRPGRVVVALRHDCSPPLVADDTSQPDPVAAGSATSLSTKSTKSVKPTEPADPQAVSRIDLRGVAGHRATSLTKILLAEFNTGKFMTERRRVGLNTSPNQR